MANRLAMRLERLPMFLGSEARSGTGKRLTGAGSGAGAGVDTGEPSSAERSQRGVDLRGSEGGRPALAGQASL